MKYSAYMTRFLNMVKEKTGDPDAYYPSVYEIDNGFKKKVVFSVRYRKRNRNGRWTQKTYEMKHVIKYCPFSGEKLEDEKPDS